MKALGMWIALLCVVSLAACQPARSGGGGGSGGPDAGGTPVPDTGGRPVAFECATLSSQVCTPPGAPATASLAPFEGALEIDVGDVSISAGDTTHFSVLVARESIIAETQWWAAALLIEGGLCYGTDLPASGWQWVSHWTDGFGACCRAPEDTNADYERHANYGFTCPSLTLGPHTMWAIIGPDDALNGTVDSAWAAVQNLGLPPDDPAVLPYVTHTAVITFNAVP